MRKLTQFVTWPVISGILLAIILLQQFPELATTSPMPHAFKEASVVPSIQPTPVSSAFSGPVSYAEGVRKAAPAVVNIYTTKIIRRRSHPLLDDPFFRQFFGEGQLPRQERMQSSLGSGVIVSEQGYILTNNHVISGADEIKVALRDGRETIAQVVGTDPETDLAVLKVNLSNLPVVVMGASANAEVGDVVLAIGNPFGVGQTVTMGIISATNRNQLGLSTFENFIQTDAAINPGNSGGALINPFGQLLGINTAIFSKSGGSQGIGFAIPSELARQIMADIIQYGSVVRGWLGVEIQELTPQLAQSFGLQDTNGIIIAGLLRDGPAHRAGIKPGDVITHIDRRPVNNGRDAINRIAQTRPNSTVELTVLRNGRQLKIDATVGRRPVPN